MEMTDLKENIEEEKEDEEEIQTASLSKWLIRAITSFHFNCAKSFTSNTSLREIFQQILFVFGISIGILANSWFIQKMANSVCWNVH